MAVLPAPDPPSIALPAQSPDVAWPTDRWPTGPVPADIADALDRWLDQAFPATDDDPAVEARFGRSLAFVAVHRGRLVAERYGPTAGPEEQLISWSMAKSISHALVGILIGQGRLALDQPAPIGAWTEPGDQRSTITIDHLLRMVPGLRFNEDYVDETVSHCIEMLFGTGAEDMAAYTAAQPLDHRPGSQFNYASGTTNLLCRIMADLVGPGPGFEAWMRAELLDRLGIDARLTFDGAGTWVGSSYLHATARDFARFGLLYLRDGTWAGERLLPEGWVDHGRTVRARDDDGGLYGAHWWIRPDEPSVFYASGYETQRIIVDPGRDLVLVRLGKTPVELAPNVDRWLTEIGALFGA